MPVRAPVTNLTSALYVRKDGETSDAKFVSSEIDHALVRVGSAAMPAPFAFRGRRFSHFFTETGFIRYFRDEWCR